MGREQLTLEDDPRPIRNRGDVEPVLADWAPGLVVITAGVVVLMTLLAALVLFTHI